MTSAVYMHWGSYVFGCVRVYIYTHTHNVMLLSTCTVCIKHHYHQRMNMGQCIVYTHMNMGQCIVYVTFLEFDIVYALGFDIVYVMLDIVHVHTSCLPILFMSQVRNSRGARNCCVLKSKP